LLRHISIVTCQIQIAMSVSWRSLVLAALCLSGCSAERGFHQMHMALTQDENASTVPLKVLVFSDVHGSCKKDGSMISASSHIDEFKASKAAEKIATTDAHIILFGGDSTLIPNTIMCEDSNFEELNVFLDWFITIQPGKLKVFIPGNHDVCLDESSTADDAGQTKKTRREALFAKMANNNIYYIGAAGWLEVPLGGEVSFKVLASGMSQGRPPGMTKFAEGFGLSETGPFGPEKLGGKIFGACLGAFQYCPATGAETSNVDCADTVQKVTEMIQEASGRLGNEADLALMHGPPENLGVKFGPGGGTGPTGQMADAIMKPLLVKNGVLRVGHYHPTSDWTEGHRTQTLTCAADGCSGAVEMKFVSVKAQRPEICDYPSADDAMHVPDEHTFAHLQVTQLGVPTNYGNVVNRLTQEVTGKYTWTGPTFQEAETTRMYKVVERHGKNVIQPVLE